MRCFVGVLFLLTCVFGGLFFVHPTSACHLPAVLPILPGSDHSHERHAERLGVNHAFQNYSGANLTDACFGGVSLMSTNLRNVKAAGASFYQSTLVSADFTGADLRGANLTEVNAFGATFDDASLIGAVLGSGSRYGETFASASFNGADLSSAAFQSMSFAGTSFVGATLHFLPRGSDVDFTGADMRRARISLEDPNERFNAILLGADLRGARLDGLRFGNSLAGVDLRGASIVGTELSYDLRGAKLDGHNFTLDNFDGGDMRWASLRNVTFPGSRILVLRSRFEAADMRGADLRDTGDGFRNFDRFTVYDLTTQFPDGFDSVLSPMTLYGDNNDDSVVDVEDLNNVRNHFGETGVIGLPGDTVFDGVVNLEDLNAVRNAFGDRAVAPVPEPACWVLLCGGLCLPWPRVRINSGPVLAIFLG